MAFGPDGVFAFPGPWPSGNDESADRAPPRWNPRTSSHAPSPDAKSIVPGRAVLRETQTVQIS